MDGRLFKRLLVAFVFAIVFIMIAKFFLGKTLGYLNEAALQKKQAAAIVPASAPVVASPLAETPLLDSASAVPDAGAASGAVSIETVSAPVAADPQ